MSRNMVKLPIGASLRASLDMLRLRGDCSDAVVILINDATGECKMGSLRGDTNYQVKLLKETLLALERQRGPVSGIITF